MTEKAISTTRGSPLAVLGLLLVSWIGGRAMFWENPFGQMRTGLPELPGLLAQEDADDASPAGAQTRSTLAGNAGTAAILASQYHGSQGLAGRWSLLSSAVSPPFTFSRSGAPAMDPRVAAGHQLLWAAALSNVPVPTSVEQALTRSGDRPSALGTSYAPQFAPSQRTNNADRWSLDAWAFWRQGSGASAISQGRVPIYGASQVGASLQFRLAPASGRDPRLYARAYRALVSIGETELAAGVSARPLAQVPLRAQAEVRFTDNAFRTEVRPAVLVVTELAPQPLPGGLVAETYAQAGYVGGTDATGFVDGQLAVTGEVATFDLAPGKSGRLSVGAGVWGGAQKDAARVDLGPSLRLDLTIGKVPARLSVDWREQVAGDAAPDSGVAATLSTRF